MFRQNLVFIGLALISGLGIIAAAVWILAPIVNSPRSIEFVVPDDHRDLICLVEDTQGTTIRRDQRGIYRLIIPQSGRLAVANLDIFREWHHTSCVTSGGTKVPVASSDETPVHQGTVALRHVFDAGNGTGGQDAYYVIGTEQDRRKAETSILATTPIRFRD
ncbi:MAG TPA: hypothetical protein VMP01_17885 [Pirellulaceae bacterium]|nr:hypothetical protein [Pirellulaceae bacterium]